MSLPPNAEGAVKKLMPDLEMFRANAAQQAIEKAKKTGGFLAEELVPSLGLHKKEPHEADTLASEQQDLEAKVAEARLRGTTISMLMPETGPISGIRVKHHDRPPNLDEISGGKFARPDTWVMYQGGKPIGLQPAKYGLGEALSETRKDQLRGRMMPDEGTIGKAIKNVQRASENSEEEFFGKAWPKLLKATGLLVSPKKDSDVELAAQRAVKDVSEFVKENPKFSDYYDADLKAAREIIGKNLGKPLSDDEFKMFQLANGLFSNRTPLVSNTRESIETVKLLRNNGNLDGFSTYENPLTGSRKVGDTPFSVSGASAPNKIMAINGINKLLKEQGSVGAVVDYLQEGVPMKELNEFNKSLGYKGNVTDPGAIKEAVRFATGQDEKIPRMFAFGKKVGAYTLNNLGDSRYNTVDVWESRFIKSYFKGMLEHNTNIAHGIDEHAIFSRFVNKFNDYYRSEIDPNAPSSAMQAARWFYIMDAVKKAGYTRVMSQKTISQYAQRYFDENPPQKTP